MQALAAEFNLSETTFVLPPADPANTARVRIFNRRAEMPFAGHPNVGTGWVLARQGRAKDGMLRFEEIAGLVEIEVRRRRGHIAAPQPLSLGPEMPVELVAACVGLAAGDVVTKAHRPVCASVGNSFVIAEVTGEALTPRDARHRPVPRKPRRPTRRWARTACRSISTPMTAARIRTRMFSPLSGTVEDPATGSAATPLAALLLSLDADGRSALRHRPGRRDGPAEPAALLGPARRRTASAPRSAAAACRCCPAKLRCSPGGPRGVPAAYPTPTAGSTR